LAAQEEHKSLLPAHFLGSKYVKIAFAVGALPWTPLWSLQRSPAAPSWI